MNYVIQCAYFILFYFILIAILFNFILVVLLNEINLFIYQSLMVFIKYNFVKILQTILCKLYSFFSISSFECLVVLKIIVRFVGTEIGERVKIVNLLR